MLLAAALALLQPGSQSTSSVEAQPPWIVVDRPERSPFDHPNLSNPQLLLREDGTLVASYEYTGHHGAVLGTFVLSSADGGRTWTRVSKLEAPRDPSLFEHRGSIHLLGIDGQGGSWEGRVLIRSSDDGGSTWTYSVLRGEDRLSPCSGPVVRREGRLWKAFYRVLRLRDGWHFVVASAADDADLLRPESWRWSGEITTDDLRRGWGSSSALLAEGDGPPVLLLRTKGETFGLGELSRDGWSLRRKTEFTPWTQPQDAMSPRFVRDAAANSLFALTGRKPSDESNRRAVDLMSSRDCLTWTSRGTLLDDSRSNGAVFSGADYLIAGEDLLAVIIASLPEPNAESTRSRVLVFLRVPRFRERTPADPPLWRPAAPR